MLKAIVVDPENIERCRELLNVYHIPQRAIEEPTWLVWGSEDWPEVRLLPHAIFRDRYVILDHREDYMLVEKL